jgi:hypothetical protein
MMVRFRSARCLARTAAPDSVVNSTETVAVPVFLIWSDRTAPFKARSSEHAKILHRYHGPTRKCRRISRRNCIW